MSKDTAVHILFIMHSISLYGASRSVIDLAAELKKMGQRVYFFVPFEGRIEERYTLKRILDQADIHYMFLCYYPSIHNIRERGLSPRAFRMKENKKCLQEMEGYVKLWEIDIIHTNSFTHTIGAQLSHRVKKPHVWHIREALRQDFAMVYDSKLLYKRALKETAQVICISEYVRRIHKKMLSGSRVTVLYNGFAVDRYILNEAFQKTLSLFTLLICGSIREEKGQLDAVKAVDLLIHDYHIETIRLKIVGNGVGEYIETIKSYIRARNLERYVEFMPFQVELKEIRREADITLMCSQNEALGRVTIESMLSENIVIGTNSAGTAEIIEDGVNGYLYEVGNVQELSRKIYDAITHWNEQEQVVKKAKQLAKERYDIAGYAQRILDIYMALLQTGR